MKRIIVLLLVALATAALTTAACAETQIEVEAKNNNDVYLRAMVNDDGTARLTMCHVYNNTNEELILPSEMTVNGTTYIISELDTDGSYFAASGDVKISRLMIPDSIHIKGSIIGTGAYEYQEFIVSDTHPTLAAVDGVLFDKTTNTLLSYPQKKEGHEYVIPNGTAAIAARAFNDADYLESVVIPDSVVKVEANPFTRCINMKRLMVSDTNPALALIQNNLYDKAERRLISSISEAEKIVVPEGIVTIGDYAFVCYYAAKQVVLPSTVTSIGDSAFEYRSSLVVINLPEGLTSIGDRAFYHCEKLAQLTLPSTLTHMGANCFEESGLTEISIPQGVDTIAEKAFASCKSLARVSLPSDLKTIRDQAFYACRSLSELTLPAGLETIGNSAFSCSGLTSVVMPDSVKNIGEYTFYQCKALTAAVLPDASEELPPNIFADCEQLVSIQLPFQLKKLNSGAFSGCTALQQINLPDTLESISYSVFNNNKQLKELFIPESVVKIESTSFTGCDDLLLSVISGSIAEGLAIKYNWPYAVVNAPAIQTSSWLNPTPEPADPEVPETTAVEAPVEAPVGSSDWFCPNCGHQNSGNFCVECGTAKPAVTQVCPGCGYAFPDGVTYKFCPNCGLAQAAPASAGDNPAAAFFGSYQVYQDKLANGRVLDATPFNLTAKISADGVTAVIYGQTVQMTYSYADGVMTADLGEAYPEFSHLSATLADGGELIVTMANDLGTVGETLYLRRTE